MERVLLDCQLDQMKPRLRCRECRHNNSNRQQLRSMHEQSQTAGIGASAVVDTRLLGKPVAFDGRETIWRSFKFQFVAYCGAIDSRLKGLLVLGESRDVAATRNIHIDPDSRSQSSAVLHADHGVEGAQKLLEHAGDTEGGVARRQLDEKGRRCPVLQALLHYVFQASGPHWCSAPKRLLEQTRLSIPLKITLRRIGTWLLFKKRLRIFCTRTSLSSPFTSTTSKVDNMKP